MVIFITFGDKFKKKNREELYIAFILCCFASNM